MFQFILKKAVFYSTCLRFNTDRHQVVKEQVG